MENPAGLAPKQRYDEANRILRSTAPVSRPYPYHYGFVLNTSAADGDHLDGFVLSERRFESGMLVDGVVLGLMEQWEDGLVDHDMLACPVGEGTSVTASVQRTLTEFVAHVFDHLPGKVVRAGAVPGCGGSAAPPVELPSLKHGHERRWARRAHATARGGQRRSAPSGSSKELSHTRPAPTSTLK